LGKRRAGAIFFTKYAFERFIEIGPGPTLNGMATRTLKAKYELQDDSISRNRAILLFIEES
jgi:fatty acid synthase subunit alpha